MLNKNILNKILNDAIKNDNNKLFIKIISSDNIKNIYNADKISCIEYALKNKSKNVFSIMINDERFVKGFSEKNILHIFHKILESENEEILITALNTEIFISKISASARAKLLSFLIRKGDKFQILIMLSDPNFIKNFKPKHINDALKCASEENCPDIIDMLNELKSNYSLKKNSKSKNMITMILRLNIPDSLAFGKTKV